MFTHRTQRGSQVEGWHLTIGEPELPRPGARRAWRFVTAKCLEPHCGHTVYMAVPDGADMSRLAALAEHRATHAPAAVRDIAVSWQLVAWCSVCPDGVGDLTADGEQIVCRACGTTWVLDGTGGVTPTPDPLLPRA